MSATCMIYLMILFIYLFCDASIFWGGGKTHFVPTDFKYYAFGTVCIFDY